jgi:asparagine synthase (glutamine-hydrolysing)
MRSDVKVGACLSGGIDSSAIVSMVSSLFPGISMDTFTIFFDGKHEVDERPWVNEVVKQYPNLNPHFYKPGNDELGDAFEKTQYYADVPLSGSSYLSQYFVMRLASQHRVKVLLDGQGSDEYLAGYMHSFDRLIGDMLRKGNLIKAFQTLAQHKKIHGQSIKQSAYVALKGFISGFNDEDSFYRYAYNYKFPTVMSLSAGESPFTLQHQKGVSRFDDFLYHLVFSTSLPALLHFEDRNSMAFSIESRVPFLDHRLVENGFSLKDEDKIFRGETKHILRHSLKGILPEAIISRQDKKGFVTPGEEKWLRGPLKYLLEMDFSEYDFIDNHKVQGILEAYNHGKSNATIVWRLAALHHWLGRM